MQYFSTMFTPAGLSTLGESICVAAYLAISAMMTQLSAFLATFCIEAERIAFDAADLVYSISIHVIICAKGGFLRLL